MYDIFLSVMIGLVMAALAVLPFFQSKVMKWVAVVLGVVGISFIYWQARQNAEDQRALRDQLTQIQANTSRPPSVVVIPPTQKKESARLRVTFRAALNLKPGQRPRVDVEARNVGDLAVTNFYHSDRFEFVDLRPEQVNTAAETIIVNKLFNQMKSELDKVKVQTSSQIPPREALWYSLLVRGPELQASDFGPQGWIIRDDKVLLAAGMLRYSEPGSSQYHWTEYCGILKAPLTTFRCLDHNAEVVP